MPHQISRSTHQNASFKHEKCGVTQLPIYIHDADSLQDRQYTVHTRTSTYYVDKTRKDSESLSMPTQSATTSRYSPLAQQLSGCNFAHMRHIEELSCKSEGSGHRLAGGMLLTQSISHEQPTYQERRRFGIAKPGTENSWEVASYQQDSIRLGCCFATQLPRRRQLLMTGYWAQHKNAKKNEKPGIMSHFQAVETYTISFRYCYDSQGHTERLRWRIPMFK